MPDIRLMCASHDEPPKVGDSTKADTTSRPVSRIAASNCARPAASGGAMSGRSKLIAPYDSMKIRKTSAPCTRARSAFIAGLARERRRSGQRAGDEPHLPRVRLRDRRREDVCAGDACAPDALADEQHERRRRQRRPSARRSRGSAMASRRRPPTPIAAGR